VGEYERHKGERHENEFANEKSDGVCL
jgi:hypothetical protein